MVDGADYPGYPEPEPKPGLKSKGVALIDKTLKPILKFSHSLMVTGRMLMAATVGAIIGANMSQDLPENTSPEVLMILIFFVMAIYIAQYFVQKQAEKFLDDERIDHL